MPILCGETMSPVMTRESVHFRRIRHEIKSCVPKWACGAAADDLSTAYWMVSTALVDEPKSPSVRNDRLKPTFCDTSLVIELRVSENVMM